jgi:hypothetical protein
MLLFGLLLILATVTACVRERSEPAASPRAGCKATGNRTARSLGVVNLSHSVERLAQSRAD